MFRFLGSPQTRCFSSAIGSSLFSPAPFSSLRLDLVGRPRATENVIDHLKSNLEPWRTGGINTVWIHLKIPDHSSLLSTLPELGFLIHHAKGKTLTLMRWLPSGPVKVPPYGGTQLGVGGVVVDSDGKFLLVRERSGTIWKFPGGLSDVGEDLDACIVREVFEEVGVKTRFEGLLALRHMHGMAFGVSDLYALALLTPLSHEIRIDTGEIAEAKWMKAEEFLDATTHPLMKSSGRLALEVAREKGWIARGGIGEGTRTKVRDSEKMLFFRHPVFSTVSKKWTSCYMNELLT